MAPRFLLVLLTCFCFVGGCIELQAILAGVYPDTGDGPPPANGDGGTPSDGTSGDRPVVTLTVSNNNPVVNEEVLLRCSLTTGDPAGLRYAFEPAGFLVGVNPVSGTAAFIPSAPDAGTEFRFTCTATTDAGTSEPSNTQVIIPLSAG